MTLPDGVRVELIDGEFFSLSPSPRPRHQRIAANLFVALRTWVDDHPLGTIWIAPLDVHLPTGDIVQPDVMFVSDTNSRIIQDWIRGAPDLVVEVLSPTNSERDRIVKRDIYAHSGVAEYWIVDDSTKTIEVLVLHGEQYLPHGYFELSDSIESRVLPGLRLALRHVFK